MPPRIKRQQFSLHGPNQSRSSVYRTRNGLQRIQRFSCCERQQIKPGSGFDKHTPNAERGEKRALERAAMSEFLNIGVGSKLRQPLPRSTNYLNAYNRGGQLLRVIKSEKGPQGKGSIPNTLKGGLPPETEEDLRPFPLNKQFLSQPVLSEELRTELWSQVREKGRPLKAVSADFGVSIERVAAVVRMKQMERNWIDAGIPLAEPYSKAVLSMLPKTPLERDIKSRPVHESINDVYVHPSTKSQLFFPVSESRQFTREDAGHAFDRTLLPTERRIPHPEMVQGEKWIQEGIPLTEVANKMQDLLAEDAKRRSQKEARQQEKEARDLQVVSAGRWNFRFHNFDAADVGKDGRRSKAVGFRYGAPHEDRKKGQIKIPTKVVG